MFIFSIYITALLLLLPQAAGAEFYKYVDDKGTVHFTNTPSRDDAVLIFREKGASAATSPDRGVSPWQGSIEDYKVLAEKTAKRYSLDPELVKAVIEIESGWNPRAVSSRGAIGLMQLMPDTAMDMGVRNPYDPKQNIEGGVKYLKHLLERFGDITLALAAYNAGPTVVKRYGTVPPYSETMLYVQDILFKYNNDKGSPSGLEGRKGKERFYKVVFEDGRILYTNTPLYLKGLSSF